MSSSATPYTPSMQTAWGTVSSPLGHHMAIFIEGETLGVDFLHRYQHPDNAT